MLHAIADYRAAAAGSKEKTPVTVMAQRPGGSPPTGQDSAICRFFGESTPEASAWCEEMMGVVVEVGPLALLGRVGELHRSLRAKNIRR